MFKRIIPLLALGFSLLVGMGSASAAGRMPSPLSPEVTVSVGMKFAVSDAGILIGIEKGYYREMGINIKPYQFASGQEMITQLASGGIDVGCTVTASGLFNAMLRDINVKIVADKGYNVPNKGYYRLVVRKDLAGKIKDFEDLKGRTFGIVGKDSLDEIALDQVLKKAGLTTRDNPKVKVIGSFPDLVVALGNGSIDAAMLIEPFCTQAVAKGFGDLWKDPKEYSPDAQVALLVFSNKFQQAKGKEVARRFMIAYLKAVRDYNDAFFRNKNKDEIIDILVKASTTKDAKLIESMLPAGLNPNGYVRMKGIQSDIDWYMSRNLLTEKLTLADAVDNQYVDYALGILGEYK